MSLKFDSSNDVLTGNTDNILQYNAAWTVMCKINVTAFQSYQVRLLSSNNGSGGVDIRIFATGDNTIGIEISGSTQDFSISPDFTPFVGVDTICIFTYDGLGLTTSGAVYLNSATAASTTSVAGIGLISNSGATMYVGNRAAQDRGFIGTFEGAAIWNRVLNSTEISNLIGGSAPSTISSGLQANWGMVDHNDGSAADGETVADSSGNSRNLTVSSTGITWGGTAPKVVIVSPLSLTLSLPSIIKTVLSKPPPLNLTTKLVSPVPSISNIISPLSRSLVLPGVTISTAAVKTVPVSPLSLSISVIAPVQVINIAPTPLALTSSLIAPIKSITINPNPLSITSALIAPTKTVQFLASALAAVFALQQSTMIVNASANALAATLALPGSTPMVINVPGAQAITLLLNPVGLSGSSTKTVIVAPLSLTASLPGLTPSIAVNPNALAITVSLPGTTQASAYVFNVNALSIALALGTSTTESRALIGPLSLTSLLGGTKPQVSKLPLPLSLVSALANVQVNLAFNATVIIAPLNLLIAVQSATVGAVYRPVRLATRHNAHKVVNQINALRRITRIRAVKKQVHSGL